MCLVILDVSEIMGLAFFNACRLALNACRICTELRQMTAMIRERERERVEELLATLTIAIRRLISYNC